MNREKPIESKAKSLLKSLDDRFEELRIIRKQLSSNLEDFSRDRSLENEYKLEGSVLLADSVKRKITVRDNYQNYYEGRDKFKVYIQGNWGSHEFSRVFDSFNKIYQLVFFEEVVIERLRRSGERLDTRNDVYEGAKLHYFITNRESLQVSRINYNSPGDIEFLTKVAEHAPELIKNTILIVTLCKYAPQLIMNLSSAYRKSMEDIFHVRDLRRIDRREERKEKIERFTEDFIDRVIPELAERYIEITDEQKRIILRQAVSELRKKIKNISTTEVVNIVKLIGDVIESLRTIAISESNDKTTIPVFQEIQR
ncbi:hypothetical protein [Phaeodactylibacter xiamenensis]|uniref:hypothetical protein n=1 Tax=Phaeodactylibacter xiamenensis TaxID=1524460 RepID=UPI003CCC35CB